MVPTSLAASLATIVAFAPLASEVRQGRILVSPYSALIGLGVLIAGWIGIITSWRLYYHFHKTNQPPNNKLVYWLGLFCGSVTSIIFAFSSGGDLLFNILFFGWPLLAVIVFSIMLLSRSKTT